MNYLLSYNHSGNTWVRYCIEFLTQLPTYGHQKFSISQRKNNFLNVNLSEEPIVLKRHEMSDFELKNNDKIILLIRDPKDAIKQGSSVSSEFEKYYKLIILFENFSGKKQIIKYNDLFCFPTINFIINFFDLNVEKSRLIELENNFEHHLRESKSIYQNEMMIKGAEIETIISKEMLDYVRKYV